MRFSLAFRRPPEIVYASQVESVAKAMIEDGRLSHFQAQRIASLVRGEKVNLRVFVRRASRVLPPSVANDFREFLSEETGVFIPPRLPFLAAMRLRKPSHHSSIFFKSTLSVHPLRERIQEAISSLNAEEFSYNLENHLNSIDSRYWLDRINQIRAFAERSSVHRSLLGEALRIGSLHSVEHFIRVLNAREENAFLLKSVLSSCSNPGEVREAARLLKDFDLRKAGVRDFVSIASSGTTYSNAFDGFRKSMSLLGDFLRERDSLAFYRRRLREVVSLFKSGEYDSNQARALRALHELGGVRLFSKEELFSIGKSRDFIQEFRHRLGKKLLIEREARLLPPEERKDFVSFAEETVLIHGVPLTATKYRRLKNLEKLFLAEGKGNSGDSFDFKKMVAIPLLEVSSNDADFKHGVSALRKFALKKIGSGASPSEHFIRIHELPESQGVFPYRTDYRPDSWHRKVVSYLIARHSLSQFARVFSSLKEFRTESDAYHLFYDDMTGKRLISGLMDSPSPRASAEVVKEGMKEILRVTRSDKMIIEDAIRKADFSGVRGRIDFLKRVAKHFPKELSREDRKRLLSYVDEVSYLFSEKEEIDKASVVSELSNRVRQRTLFKLKDYFRALSSLTAIEEESRLQDFSRIAAREVLKPVSKHLGGNEMLELFEKGRGHSVEEVERVFSLLHNVFRGSRFFPQELVRRYGFLAFHPRFKEFITEVASVWKELERRKKNPIDSNPVSTSNIGDVLGTLVQRHGIDVVDGRDNLKKVLSAWKYIHFAAADKIGLEYNRSRFNFFGENGVAHKLIDLIEHPRFKDLVNRNLELVSELGNKFPSNFSDQLNPRLLSFFSQSKENEKQYFSFLDNYQRFLKNASASSGYQVTSVFARVFESPEHAFLWSTHFKNIQRITEIRDSVLARELIGSYLTLLERVPGERFSSLLEKYVYSREKASAEDIEAFLKRDKSGKTPHVSETGFVWTPERIDLLHRVMRTQKDWSHERIAQAINEKAARPNLPVSAFIPAVLISSEEELLSSLRRVFEKRDFKKSQQLQYQFTGFLNGLADPVFDSSHSRVVLEKVVSLLSPVAGDKVSEVMPSINRLSTLLAYKESESVARLAQEISLNRINSFQELDSWARKETARLISKNLNISEEMLESEGIDKEHLLAWSETHHYQIISTLVNTYRHTNPVALSVLAQIALRLMKGKEAYLDWRYENEVGLRQLASLSEPQRTAWRRTDERVFSARPVALEEFLSSRHASAMASIKEALEHARGEIPSLGSDIKALEEKIKEARELFSREPDENRLKEIVRMESLLDLAQNFSYLRTMDFSKDDPSLVRDALEIQSIIREKLEELGFVESADDLIRFRAALTSTWSKDSGGEFRVFDTDDPDILFEIGEKPVHSCQSYLNGSFNQCLLAYVADANKKAFVVSDAGGELVARSIAKLMPAEVEGVGRRSILFMEPVYSRVYNEEYHRAILRHALEKSVETGSVVALSRSPGILREEAEALGYQVVSRKVTLFAPPSVNAFEYSDSFGVINAANQGYSLETTVYLAIPPGE